MTTTWLVVAVAIAPLETALAQTPVYQAPGKVHYAKTELEKAAGKCKMTLIGGALLGAGLGGLFGGKKGAAIGVAGGLAAGAGACAIITANAKHKDQIIAAQLAAARSDQAVTSSWTDDSGNAVTLTAQRGAGQQMNGADLVPIKYLYNNQESASPVLASTDQPMCYVVGSSITSASSSAQKLPDQRMCRDSKGDYYPYAASTA